MADPHIRPGKNPQRAIVLAVRINCSTSRFYDHESFLNLGPRPIPVVKLLIFSFIGADDPLWLDFQGLIIGDDYAGVCISTTILPVTFRPQWCRGMHHEGESTVNGSRDYCARCFREFERLRLATVVFELCTRRWRDYAASVQRMVPTWVWFDKSPKSFSSKWRAQTCKILRT